MKKETADKLSLQEFVDHIMGKLVKQGERCTAEGEGKMAGCAYGDGNGSHCAVGWGLDGRVPALMNFEEGVDVLVGFYGDKLPNHIVDNIDLFEEIQTFHDSESRKSREEYLGWISERKVLDMSKSYWQAWVELGAPEGEGDW